MVSVKFGARVTMRFTSAGMVTRRPVASVTTRAIPGAAENLSWRGGVIASVTCAVASNIANTNTNATAHHRFFRLRRNQVSNKKASRKERGLSPHPLSRRVSASTGSGRYPDFRPSLPDELSNPFCYQFKKTVVKQESQALPLR